MAPVFVAFVDDEAQVTLNDEHSEYAWFSFEEALQQVTLPGNDRMLSVIEKHFAKTKPYTQLEVGYWLNE